MKMPDPYQQIVQDLERLSQARATVFGSEAHGFRPHPTVPERELIDFEINHGICLPEEYRDFLLRVGRGGAGPYHGLFDLGEMDDGFDCKPWQEGGDFVGVLSKPFPFTEPWNDLTGEPDEQLADEDVKEYERQLEQFEERYWAPLDGAIPVCHIGCALRQWLVVTGPEAGYIWNDDRADRNGLTPLTDGNSQRVSFLSWYRNWLDEALQKLE